MYEGIFDDFAIVKRHCKRNGDIAFEESAVFELLENLFPQHGSVQAVQIVIEMLDAQRIRDCKEPSSECKSEDLNSDKSNDTDSIIEVEVPQKHHPFIDLTNNSPQSDELVCIEKSNKEHTASNMESDLDSDVDDNNYGASDNDFNGLSDSDVSKQFEDDWNIKTAEDIMQSNNASPLMNCLSMLQDHTKPSANQLEADQNNSDIPEAPEMLEENNNDPNNNLDGGIFDEPTIPNNPTDHNPYRIVDTYISGHSNSSNASAEVISLPGCSKDTGIILYFTCSCAFKFLIELEKLV